MYSKPRPDRAAPPAGRTISTPPFFAVKSAVSSSSGNGRNRAPITQGCAAAPASGVNQTSTTARAGSASAPRAPWAALSAKKLKPSWPVIRHESPWRALTSSAGVVPSSSPASVGAPRKLRKVADLDAEVRLAIQHHSGTGVPAGDGRRGRRGAGRGGRSRRRTPASRRRRPSAPCRGRTADAPLVHAGGVVDRADAQHGISWGSDVRMWLHLPWCHQSTPSGQPHRCTMGPWLLNSRNCW